MKAAHLGDAALCDPKRSSGDKMKYCNDNFDTDANLNKDCKDPD